MIGPKIFLALMALGAIQLGESQPLQSVQKRFGMFKPIPRAFQPKTKLEAHVDYCTFVIAVHDQLEEKYVTACEKFLYAYLAFRQAALEEKAKTQAEAEEKERQRIKKEQERFWSLTNAPVEGESKNFILRQS